MIMNLKKICGKGQSLVTQKNEKEKNIKYSDSAKLFNIEHVSQMKDEK